MGLERLSPCQGGAEQEQWEFAPTQVTAGSGPVTSVYYAQCQAKFMKTRENCTKILYLLYKKTLRKKKGYKPQKGDYTPICKYVDLHTYI